MCHIIIFHSIFHHAMSTIKTLIVSESDIKLSGNDFGKVGKHPSKIGKKCGMEYIMGSI